MQFPTSTVFLPILLLSFLIPGCGWRTSGAKETDDTDSETDTVDTNFVSTDNTDSEKMHSTDIVADSESASNEDSDTAGDSETIGPDDSDTCPPCGSVAAGDMNITEDINLDVYFRAFYELKRKLDAGGEETQSLLVQAAADWDIDDTGLSVTDLADALATAIRSDIETHTQDGVTVEGNTEPSCRILEEETLETEIRCEVDMGGCDCTATFDDIDGDFICNGVCQGHCTGECYCEVDGETGLYDTTLCDDSVLCDSKCRGVCDGGCLGEIIPPPCDTSCESSGRCRYLAADCSPVHLSCTPPSLTLKYSPADDMDETSTVAFESRMVKLGTLIESLRRELSLLRYLFDCEYAVSAGFVCPSQNLYFELDQSWVNNVAKGSFKGPVCKAPCIQPALAESIALKNSFYSDAIPYIEAQIVVIATLDI